MTTVTPRFVVREMVAGNETIITIFVPGANSNHVLAWSIEGINYERRSAIQVPCSYTTPAGEATFHVTFTPNNAGDGKLIVSMPGFMSDVHYEFTVVESAPEDVVAEEIEEDDCRWDDREGVEWFRRETSTENKARFSAPAEKKPTANKKFGYFAIFFTFIIGLALGIVGTFTYVINHQMNEVLEKSRPMVTAAPDVPKRSLAKIKGKGKPEAPETPKTEPVTLPAKSQAKFCDNPPEDRVLETLSNTSWLVLCGGRKLICTGEPGRDFEEKDCQPADNP